METPNFKKREWKNPLWNKGKYNPMFGKHHSKKTKDKVSVIHKGKHFSPKTEFKKGHPFSLKHHSKATKKLISKRKKKLVERGWKPQIFGKHHSEKTKEKMRLKRKKYYEKNPDAKDKSREKRKKQILPKHHTKPELDLMKIIEKNNLPYKYVGDGKFWIENINPDFVNIDGKKICIEVFGNYWHSPLYRKILYHRTYEGRKEIAKKYGWKMIILWENEVKNEELVLSKIGGI